jgi:hypothetical protein
MVQFRWGERQRRRDKFWAARVLNDRAWSPNCDIQDLGGETQGALLFGRNFGLPQYSSTRKRPTPGS